MKIIPENLESLITENGKSLETHYEERLYGRIVRRSRDHLLVKLKGEMDFSEIERACRGYHHGSGPGAPPQHAVGKMVRVVLLKRLYGLSLRETEAQMRLNLLFRWFGGYGLWEETPDHVTIQRFEEWLEREQPRAYFDAVLSQIYEWYPEERETEQIGDTYGMKANAARQGRVQMWRAFGKKIVGEMKDAGLEGEVAEWDARQLFGGNGEKRRWEMTDDEKRERVAQTALGAQSLVGRVRNALKEKPAEEHPALRETLGYLEKTLGDEVVIDGEEVKERKRKGAYAIGSATDPEATVRNHGKKEEKKDVMLGYNVQISVTVNGLITETKARTGATPDQVGIANLVSNQQEHHGIVPQKMIYDAAAGSGKIRHEVTKASGGKMHNPGENVHQFRNKSSIDSERYRPRIPALIVHFFSGSGIGGRNGSES